MGPSSKGDRSSSGSPHRPVKVQPSFPSTDQERDGVHRTSPPAVKARSERRSGSLPAESGQWSLVAEIRPSKSASGPNAKDPRFRVSAAWRVVCSRERAKLAGKESMPSTTGQEGSCRHRNEPPRSKTHAPSRLEASAVHPRYLVRRQDQRAIGPCRNSHSLRRESNCKSPEIPASGRFRSIQPPQPVMLACHSGRRNTIPVQRSALAYGLVPSSQEPKEIPANRSMDPMDAYKGNLRERSNPPSAGMS